ncbi:MAG: hypothetical protein K2V38_25075 [Gemmataceae bacterium]|nr:hypothetical protein [Gemmataceae bacterium]
MPATAPTSDLPVLLPDPDAIRAAIGAAEERARLLSRLLRLALKLRLHLTTANNLPTPADRREVSRA